MDHAERSIDRRRVRLARPAPARTTAGPAWRLTRRLPSSGRLEIFRVAAAGELGPGCYCLKRARAAEDAVARAMLARGALVAKEAVHPHLATVLSAEVDERGPQIVMPYYEGVSLQRLLDAWRASPPTISRVCGFVRQVAEALSALHAAGWLHGQILARHVVVSPQGHATLIDLTAARRLESQECDPAWASPVAVAPSPELLSRQRLTAAADIYALGLLLFELICGKPAFEAASAKQLAVCHLRERPRQMRMIRSDVSLEVDDIVWRMLAKDPLRRPIAEDVVQWLAEVEIAELANFQ